MEAAGYQLMDHKYFSLKKVDSEEGGYFFLVYPKGAYLNDRSYLGKILCLGGGNQWFFCSSFGLEMDRYQLKELMETLTLLEFWPDAFHSTPSPAERSR